MQAYSLALPHPSQKEEGSGEPRIPVLFSLQKFCSTVTYLVVHHNVKPRKKMVEDAIVLSAKKLGYAQLKAEQKVIISSFVNGNDVFGVLPTGYGKSLCFSCLPLVFNSIEDTSNSIVLVISPLTAIMKDQVQIFRKKGLTVECICGEHTDDIKKIEDSVIAGNYQLVFFTPESMLSRKWRKVLSSDIYRERVRGLIIDEAHCIKKWGESFRSILLQVGEIRSLLNPNVKVMALTATITKEARLELQQLFEMKDPVSIILNPCKENIMYMVSDYTNITDTFSPLLNRLKIERTRCPRTIIYCRSLDECANLYLFFKSKMGREFTEPCGAPVDLSKYRLADMFTSCTDVCVKNQIVENYTKDSCLRVVIATIAFGMGVNCSDIRQVIHVGPPDDVESYVQETGRAGRDGQPSLAILLRRKGSLSQTSSCIRRYYKSTSECRRYLLFSSLEGYVKPSVVNTCCCCDICFANCACKSCCLNENFTII